MIPEIGQITIILALMIALFQSIVPMIGSYQQINSWMEVARTCAYLQLFMISISFICLVISFTVSDFSVLYVAENSNLKLPFIYKLTATWGNHEGSLLLWTLISCCWTAAVARYSRSLPNDYLARVLAILGMISVGILLFMLFTSNPFERMIPAAVTGNDLNPLLQDPGFVIHPPLLYVGYVGFSVAFSFAIAALLGGRLDNQWARWSRPWTNIAWSMLTVGITLGSWWAYYELGWGGWWFWDPVENASFMPWLIGTALIHSQAATEKRGAFKSWTLLLAIFAFSFSLLGTFLVRSGIITSVHAFATDPTRGIFILVFLGILTGSSLLLYALRANSMKSNAIFGIFSRESLILINNLFLVCAAFMVLLGTLFPLIYEVLGYGKISVGPPVFGPMFSMIIAPLVLVIAMGPFIRWKQDTLSRVGKLLSISAAIALLSIITWFIFYRSSSLRNIVGICGGAWVISASLYYLVARSRKSKRKYWGIPLAPRSVFGMSIAHLGVGVFVIGVTMTETQSTEKDIAMSPGDTYTLGDYSFLFTGIKNITAENYEAAQGQFEVSKNGEPVRLLTPEKRRYTRGQSMTEADIDPRIDRDLYVALGEPLGKDSWSVRLYHKPFIRFIWLGALFMAFGGILATMDSRYRKRQRALLQLELMEAPLATA